MALWPNARYMTRSTVKGFGMDVGLSPLNKNAGDRMNRFVSESFARNASTPDGYDVHAFVPAIRAGSMSALRPVVAMAEGTCNLLQGGPMEGTGAMTFTVPDSSLSLTVSMAGTAAVVTLTGENMVLALTIGLDGTGTMSLTGTGGLSMIVPFEGAGNVLTMGPGATDLKGLLSLQGEWTPFTELSPEGLANAVWASLATANNDPGSMGELLNSAGAAADPLLGVVEGTLTLRDFQRIILAALAGTSERTGSTITFTSPVDGATVRISGSFDAENNRTGVILDGS